MLHLFNKIYIKPDVNFAKSKHSIILSPKHVSWTEFDESYGAANQQLFGDVHFTANTYTDLIDRHFNGSHDEFFVWLLNFDSSIRLVIYCEQQSFNEIVLRWIKTILPRASSQTLYNVCKIIYQRYAYTWGYPYLPFVRLSREESKTYKQLGMSLPDFDTANRLWNNVNYKYNVSNLADKCGVEFQLATYAYNPSWEYAPHLQQKLSAMMMKYHVRLLIDMKQDLLNHVGVLPDYDCFHQTLDQYVQTNPQYRFLTDDNFLPDQWEYVCANYDVDRLRQMFFDFIGQHYITTIPVWFKDTFLKRDITIEHFMEAEQSTEFGTAVLGQWDYANLVNVPLVNYIIANLNNQPLLSELSLLGE